MLQDCLTNGRGDTSFLECKVDPEGSHVSEVHVSGSSNSTDPLARAEVLKPVFTEKVYIHSIPPPV